MNGIQRTTNDLIPLLLSKIEAYSTNMNNRIKINSIFSEFDSKTQNQLSEFIKLSNHRYKGVKSGNDLQNILQSQKSIYSTITAKITKDNFYHTKDIDEEKQKLFKRTDAKKTAEINDLRAQIKQDTKNYSKSELRIRERLLKRVERRKQRESLCLNQNPNIKSRLAYSYQPKFSFEQKGRRGRIGQQEQDDVIMKEENLEENETEKTDSIDAKRQYCKYISMLMVIVDELINEDQQKIKSSIDNYNDYLTNVKSSYYNGQTMKLNHKFNFLTEDIKMLSYKEEQCTNNEPKKKEEEAIDIIKLLRYTKRGTKSKWLNPTNKARSNRLTGCDTNNNTMVMAMAMDKTGSEFRSTRMTVKSEAEKGCDIDEVFLKKRETMSHFYKHCELPNTSEYEELIRIRSSIPSNRAAIALKRRMNDPTALQSPLSSSSNAQANANANTTHKHRNISSSFRHTYADKAQFWRQQDERNEQKKAKEIERKKELSKFFREVQHKERIPQLYIDSYSKKDGKTNQRIAQANRSLGSAFNSKRTIEKKVKGYDKRMSLIKQNNDQRLKKINDLAKGDEVSRKIKENMRDDTLPDDVELTYKVFAQKIEGRSNMQRLNPYDEFLEFKAKIEEKDKRFMLNRPLLSSRIGSFDNKTIMRVNSLVSPKKKASINLSIDLSTKDKDNNDKRNNTNAIGNADNSNKDMKFIIEEKVKE